MASFLSKIGKVIGGGLKLVSKIPVLGPVAGGVAGGLGSVLQGHNLKNTLGQAAQVAVAGHATPQQRVPPSLQRGAPVSR